MSHRRRAQLEACSVRLIKKLVSQNSGGYHALLLDV